MSDSSTWAEHKGEQREACGYLERRQAEGGLVCCADGAANDAVGDRRESALGATARPGGENRMIPLCSFALNMALFTNPP